MQCAESALKSVIGDLSHTYFVGNGPMGHMTIQASENNQGNPSLKVNVVLFCILTHFA